MPPSALPRPRRRSPIIAALLVRSRRARRLQPGAQARLRPGAARSPSAGSTATSTSTMRSRCACAPRSTSRSPGTGARSCPTTPSCSRASRPRCSSTRRPSACAPGQREIRAPRRCRHRPCAAGAHRGRADAAPQQIAHVEKRFARAQRRVPRRLPAARSGASAAEAAVEREVARRREALRHARRRAAEAASPARRRVAFRRRAAYAERLRRQQDAAGVAPPAGDAADPARGGADAEVRLATSTSYDRAPRPRRSPRRASALRELRSASRRRTLHNGTSVEQRRPRVSAARATTRRRCASWPRLAQADSRGPVARRWPSRRQPRRRCRIDASAGRQRWTSSSSNAMSPPGWRGRWPGWS